MTPLSNLTVLRRYLWQLCGCSFCNRTIQANASFIHLKTRMFLGVKKRRMICAVASGRRWSPGYWLKPDAFLDTPFPQTHLTYSHRDESYTKGMKGGQIAGLAWQDDVLLFFLTCLPQTHTFLLRFFLTDIKLSVTCIRHKLWQISVSFCGSPCHPLLRLMTNFVGICCFRYFRDWKPFPPSMLGVYFDQSWLCCFRVYLVKKEFPG